MINPADRSRDKTGTLRADVVAKVLSAIFVAAAVGLNFAPLPYPQEFQVQQALMTIGVLAWPATVLPWLSGRLSVGEKWFFGMLGILLGYWVQGQPLVVFTYERMLLNTRLLPYLGGAAAVLLGLVAGIPRIPMTAGTAVKAWIPSCALVAVLAWTLSVVVPVIAVLNLKPGQLAIRTLAVSETYLFEAPDKTGLAGCRFGEVAVICGPEAVLIRFPNGDSKTTKISLDPGSLEIAEGAGSVLVLDKKSGVLHCVDITGGDLVWTADGLGTVNQVEWTDSFGWFLDRPDSPDFDPAEAEIVLNRVDLRSGSRATWTLVPPEGWFWPEASDYYIEDWPGAQLGVCGDYAFVYIAVRGDLTSQVPESAIFIATPRETGSVPWTLTRIPEGSNNYISPDTITAARDAIVMLHFRDGLEVLVRDTKSGEERWRLTIGGDTYTGKPMLVLPDRVLLDWDSFHNPSKTGVVCLDILTGQEKWRYDRLQGRLVSMEPVGDKTLLLSQPDPSAGDFHTDVTLLDEAGRQLWTYRAQYPAYTVRLDPVGGSVTLLEGAESQLPGSGYWGIETTLRLSDGRPDVKPAAESGVPDLGNYRYLITGNVLYRSAERLADDYRALKAVMGLEGPGVDIYDLVRYADYLAGPDFVAVACRTANGVKVYVLTHQPQPNP